MKKIITLSIAFILALSMLCAGALAAPEPGDILGVWYLNSVSFAGTPVHPSQIGMDEMNMELNADNTVSLRSGNNTATGTWAIKGDQIIITPDGEEDGVFKFIDGNLCMDEPPLIFGREKAEPDKAETDEAPVK